MMILPLADALMNCLQNLTSRIAGIDNEQMTNRVMGMGAMLGFGLGTVKEQFNTPASNINNNSSTGGFKGFVTRAKSIINPSMNLSPEKDYNGNVNPIRDVLPMDNGKSESNKKRIAKNIASTSFNVARKYLSVGAQMIEGDFTNPPYKAVKSNKRKSFQNTEYINKTSNDKSQNLGDVNEH